MLKQAIDVQGGLPDEEFRQLYKEVFGERSDSIQKEGIDRFQKALLAHEYPNGGRLRDYQAEGVSWMVANMLNQRSCLLADEMGEFIAVN